MKTWNVALLVVLLSVGVTALVNADSPATIPSLQQDWFLVGYSFDAANTPAEFTLLLSVIIGDDLSPQLKDSLAEWRLGTLTKEEVRPFLLNYSQAQGGLLALEAFRLGEWTSNLEDAVIDMGREAGKGNARPVFEAMVTAYTLASQARGFIDVFGSLAPQVVLQVLEQIDKTGAKIDVAGLIIGDVEDTNLEETTTAAMDLLGLARSVRDIYTADSGQE